MSRWGGDDAGVCCFLGSDRLGVAAYAAETVSYSYDVRGRVVKVSHSGTVNNNVVANYTYDRANNRATKNRRSFTW